MEVKSCPELNLPPSLRNAGLGTRAASSARSVRCFPKHVWAIRARLKLTGNLRNLALFNVAINSQLRGCDLVSLTITDLIRDDRVRERVSVLQSKTNKPVQFELAENTRETVTNGSYRSSPHSGSGCFTTPMAVLSPNLLMLRFEPMSSFLSLVESEAHAECHKNAATQPICNTICRTGRFEKRGDLVSQYHADRVGARKHHIYDRTKNKQLKPDRQRGAWVRELR